MEAIEKMVAQVLEKGQIERDAYTEEETQKIAQQEKQELATLQKVEAETLTKNLRSLEKEYQQTMQRHETTSRQATLNMKQDYLAKLFEEAIALMNNWDQETTQAFCAKAITKVPDFPHSELVVGEYSKDFLDATWLEKVNQGKEYPITLSERVERKQGGFIVSQSGVEYNVLYSSLVREIQSADSFSIAEILFKES